MNSDQLYANGRIAVMSTRLLGADKFQRLVECKTLIEALRVLQESGYGSGVTLDNPNDYEQLLKTELDSAMASVKELCYDLNAVKFLLCKYDYTNAKLLMKGKYLREDFSAYCFDEALYAKEKMQEAFLNDSYLEFGTIMAKACDKIDTEYANGNRSPQVVDKILDQASFDEMKKYAKHSSSRVVYKLYDWLVNTSNLMLIYRLKKAGYPRDEYEQWIVDGASLKRQTLLNLWDNEGAAIDLPELYRSFYALCNTANTSLRLAEQEQISYRNKLIAEYQDFLTVQPALQYFFSKVDETEKVRRVLIDVKNGVDKDKIKDRLK
ncbi:MAG: V-type ATPase subunit [Clostridiales bacterium]|nr:V-type ATPase subunit [Clostridiales bacterium]